MSSISLSLTFSMVTTLLLLGTACSWHFYQLSVVVPLLRARRKAAAGGGGSGAPATQQQMAATQQGAEGGESWQAPARSPRARGGAAAVAAAQHTQAQRGLG